ncbi:pentatricopeptide repeat-containing protein At2g37310 [Durio zibethinus]|uniref:Pentatricopeptide repeat-containing protein At2g37310 n=1 Tax=Durio zibethinus TaxID=66656 RepID=A0A6P6ARN5_DURZI|nr:pentatricopeptide repeat-containing protein At2g37310 [Durio zibethinus]
MRTANPLLNKFTWPSTKFQEFLLTLCPSNSNLNYAAYGHLIQHFTNHNFSRQVKQLHARIVLFSVSPDNFLASKLICFYSKTNGLPQAHHLFNKITQKSTFSFNALLIAYSQHDMFADTIRLFSSFVNVIRPDNFTITCLLKALSGSVSEKWLAKEVHCFVLRGGFNEDIFVSNGLITYYSKCEEFGLARKVFDKMGERDIVSWNSMISGYSQGGFYEECKALYKDMVDSLEFRPNRVTVLSVLQACGQSNDLILGMEIHRFIVENSIEMDVMVCNALIALYAKCGSLDYASELFDGMSDKDEVTYGSLIYGCMFHGFTNKAMELFRKLKHPVLSTWNSLISGLFQNKQYDGILDLVLEMQASGFRPNAVTLSIILPTFLYFSNLKGGKEIHAYAVRNNFDCNIYVVTSLIDTYAKLGYLLGAQRVFDQSKCRSLMVWTAIIAAYAAHGDVNAALGYFHKMLNNGMQPDPVTFTALLSACAHSGMVDEAQKIFDAMLRGYGVSHSVEHYACMVGALSRAGRLSEATEFISKMPIEPNAKVWGALLHGASVCGDAELGKLICDHLFEIEPENTGNYIIMANLYSQAGRWKEADMIREKMRNVGLKKISGSSWIETSGGFESFIAMGRSSERTEEIYILLEGLLRLMKEEGYTLHDEFDEENVYV